MASFSTISIRFNADLKQFSSQMQNAQKKMRRYGDQMQRVGSGLTLGVTLPVLGLGAATVKAASDAEETASKFQTVFRDISKAAQESADNLRNSYGLSSRASQELLGDTGDLLTGFGFSQEAALDLSTEVNKLAVDLASFTNYSGGAKGASEAITKALLGERESVKSLGISILEADVKGRILKNTQEGLTFESNRQAKAFATLQLAQEQSKNAIGDYARTNKSFANQMRLVKARVEDVAVQFGEILLPYVTKLAQAAGGLIEKFSNLSPATKKLIVVVAGLAAAIGPVLVTLGFLVSNIIPALAAGFTALTGPIGLVIAAIAGIGVVIYKNWDRIKKELVSLRNYFTDLYNESLVVRIGVEQIVMVFNTLYNVAKLVIDIIITGFTKGAEFILESFKNIGAGLKAVLTGDITAIPGIFKRQADLAGRNFAALFVGISKDVSEFTKNMETDFQGSLDRIQKKTKLEFSADVTIDKVKTKKEGTDEVGDPAKDGVKGRGLVESVNEMNALPQIIGPLDALEAKLPEQSELIKNTFDGFKNGMVDISGALNNALESSIGSTAQFMGDFVGNLITGQASAQDALSGLMSIVAGFMENLGQAMIAAGVASEAFKNILGSGIGAIIAGAALVALSKVVTNIMSAGPSSSSGGGNRRVALANGGIAYGPTNALIGEYSGANNNPEVVAPLDKLRSMISDSAGASDVNVSGGFVLRGNDLLASIDRSKTRKNRRGA